ncbi:hypothetical protein H109_00513 [Trichophyton interdigitale MR816]|uniref:Fungal N-terminal domain-containing protein n=1 Tax=Trichophyton interdigitale (strain MR816) TaxID=1215338 RepID=A0A059JIX7_TRIIM|nr:hypothetical protein H101_04863 [Trichophyton interdigitale H6]KDB27719.1 hypothetical protein H109_00513 [Trichophyton interdigitale MR816]
MASPISVGDAYLMGKLAFQLGRAFTKGRKSAPAEFREVENQLYSLSAALQAFKTASRDGSASLRVDVSSLPTGSRKQDETADNEEDEDDVLAQVLRSCEQTLAHLESIVQKYGSIGRPRVQDAGQPRFRRWNDGLKHAWKTISWTTEGGDLATLRSNLTVHTNGLNLLLGVIVNTRAGRIESRVNDIDSMLYEIHAWFTENLKDTCSDTKDTSDVKAAPREDFELHESNGTQSRLVCPHATIHPDFSPHEEPVLQQKLFACQCWLKSGGRSSHQAEVAAFSHMAYIEEAMERLTLSQAKQMTLQGAETPLCFSSGPPESRHVYILNSIGDIRECKTEVKSARFSSNLFGKRYYERDHINNIQILHYKSTDLDNFVKHEDTIYAPLSPNDYAEIVISYPVIQSDIDIMETRVRLTSETKWYFDPSQQSIVFEQVTCTSYTQEKEAGPGRDMGLAICFKGSAALSVFKRKLREMQTELLVLGLQYPRVTESKLFAIQAYDVHTESVYIADAEISILRETKSNGFRLTIISRDGYTIVSQELAENFFDSFHSGNGFRFNFPAYIVQIDSLGQRRISRTSTGFPALGFSDAAVERLFSLSLAGVAKSAELERDLDVEMKRLG